MKFVKVVLKFRDGKVPPNDLTDHAIKIVSGLVHVEAFHPDGRSISSTMAGDDNGVRWKDIHYSHPERWKDVVFWLTEEEYRRYLLTCNMCAALKIPYDLRGAVGCTVTGRQDPEKYFCSEFTFDSLLAIWLPAVLNHKMHPDKLYDISVVIAFILAERKRHYESDGVDSA